MNLIRCTYLCPIRLNSINERLISEFNEYWKFLTGQGCEVLVVDGSPPHIFNIHAQAWSHCRHLKVDKKYKFLNGKVNGIMTAVLEASHEKIILADDDIRYLAEDIYQMVEGLEDYDVVRPQNYFQPLPLWTRLDAARILINRATIPEGDYPGTFGFRKSLFEAAGPFDGDVLFDNEELIKHFENFSAHINYSTNFFILRKPPILKKWLEQRPRQAYEDFIMKGKTAFFLSLLPTSLFLLMTGKWKTFSILTSILSGGAITLALQGRRGSAKKYFPAYAALYAPLWMVERSISIYLAVYWRFWKGGYPFGDMIVRKGTGEAWLKQKQKQKLDPKKLQKMWN